MIRDTNLATFKGRFEGSNPGSLKVNNESTLFTSQKYPNYIKAVIKNINLFPNVCIFRYLFTLIASKVKF